MWREVDFMKRTAMLVALICAALMAAPSPGAAGHRNTRYFFGATIGIPGPAWYGPPGWAPRPYWAYPAVIPAPPVYYAPAPVIVQQPPAYVRQPASDESDYWYYCESPRGYYPYVKSCPGGWMKVVPETVPPDQR
jgi:hypothetical protein